MSQYDEMRKELKHSIIDLDADHYRLDEFMRVIDEIFIKYRGEIEQPKIGGWIPCSERLPENAKHKGAFCPKYDVKTKYGETVGWYNPDFESWHILVWFMTERFLTEEINFERGDVPKVVKIPLNSEIVTAWREPLEAYHGQMD